MAFNDDDKTHPLLSDEAGDEAVPRGLQAIGAGFGRTGTMSLQAALDILYAPQRCYHFGSIVEESHLHVWQDAIDEGRCPDWAKLFEENGFVATMDHPCAEYWQDLMQKYPKAKVILSEHPGGPEKWYDSKSAHGLIMECMLTWPVKPIASFIHPIVTRSFRPKSKSFKHAKLDFDEVVKFINTVEANVWGAGHYVCGHLDQDTAMRCYEARYKEVKATVPADQLLVYNVKMGWGPLCQFLGKPVPDMPFPKEDRHSSAAIKQLTFRIKTVVWILYTIVLVLIVCLLMRR